MPLFLLFIILTRNICSPRSVFSHFLCLFISLNTVPHCCLFRLCSPQISGKRFEKEKRVPFFLCLFVLLPAIPSCFVPVILHFVPLLLHLPFIWVPPSVISFLIYFSFPVSTSSDVLFLIPQDHYVRFVLFVCFVLAPFYSLFKPLIVPSLSSLLYLSVCAGTVC